MVSGGEGELPNRGLLRRTVEVIRKLIATLTDLSFVILARRVNGFTDYVRPPVRPRGLELERLKAIPAACYCHSNTKGGI